MLMKTFIIIPFSFIVSFCDTVCQGKSTTLNQTHRLFLTFVKQFDEMISILTTVAMEGVDRGDIILAAEEEVFQEEVNIGDMIFAVIVCYCYHWSSRRPTRLQCMSFYGLWSQSGNWNLELDQCELTIKDGNIIYYFSSITP